MCYYFPRTSRDPRADLNSGATDNEGPYLRPSSQGSWMEAMRAHRKCVPSSFRTHTVRNQFTIQFTKRGEPMQIKKLTPNLVVRNVEAGQSSMDRIIPRDRFNSPSSV